MPEQSFARQECNRRHHEGNVKKCLTEVETVRVALEFRDEPVETYFATKASDWML